MFLTKRRAGSFASMPAMLLLMSLCWTMTVYKILQQRAIPILSSNLLPSDIDSAISNSLYDAKRERFEPDRTSRGPSSRIQNLDDSQKCNVYLAPSSVSDNENRPAGFGIFTTRPLKKGDYIFPQGEGPNVVITDLVANQKSGKVPVWAQFIFLYSCAGFNYEADDPRSDAFASIESNMNLGAFANFHPYLKNVVFDDTDFYRDNILNRYKDPGAGAFSYHMGKKFYAMRDVEAGEELFDDYGESWFLEDQLGEAGKNIPRRSDYKVAASVVLNFAEALKASGRTKVASKDIKELVFRLREKNARAASLLPTRVIDFTTMISNVKEGQDYAMALARRSVFNRSITWIEENGQCLDNILPRISTLSQAGQGAFAARFLPKGSVVVPVPTLIQVPDKTALDVYRHEKNGNHYKPIGTPISKQLIMNYCFGHDKSSMVLCPGTNGNLVNHCSVRMYGDGQCDERGPNAELRWATEFDPETKAWLTKSIDEISDLVKRGRRGLSFEIVATRDIQAGDEIFIDYGPEWERAWASHVASWRRPIDDGFISVTDMNHNLTAYLRTEDELTTNPYRSPIRLGCHLHGFYHPCTVLRRTDRMEASVVGDPLMRRPVYEVRVEKFKQPETWEFRYNWVFNEDSITTTLSTKYIRFFHGKYSSDQHLPGTFRKNIGVRDDMWPDQWKNL